LVESLARRRESLPLKGPAEEPNHLGRRGALGGFRLRIRGRRALTIRPEGSRRVRVPMLLFANVPPGPAGRRRADPFLRLMRTCALERIRAWGVLLLFRVLGPGKAHAGAHLHLPG
jgi:hypothetical protein